MNTGKMFLLFHVVTSEPAGIALWCDVIEPRGRLDDGSCLEDLHRGGSDQNKDEGQNNDLLCVLLSPTVFFHDLSGLVLFSPFLSILLHPCSSNCHHYLEVHLKGGFKGQINI